MLELEDAATIERRIKAVGAVKEVVHAIWAISRAELPMVEAAVAESSTYVDWIHEMADAVMDAPHRSSTQQVLMVVLGPERPYCGALARLILEQVVEAMDAGADPSIGLVGTRLLEAAVQEKHLENRVLFQLAGAVTHEENEQIARAIAGAVLTHAGNAEVDLFYPRDGGSRLERVTLLGGMRSPAPFPPETFSPLEQVINAAIVELITGRLAVGVAEALRSEIRARIMAAEAATRAADDKLETLRRSWAKTRQERITSELLEVIAGRQATMTHSRMR